MEVGCVEIEEVGGDFDLYIASTNQNRNDFRDAPSDKDANRQLQLGANKEILFGIPLSGNWADTLYRRRQEEEKPCRSFGASRSCGRRVFVSNLALREFSYDARLAGRLNAMRRG